MALRDILLKLRLTSDNAGADKAKQALGEVADAARNIPDADLDVNVDDAEVERLEGLLSGIADEVVNIDVETDDAAIGALEQRLAGIEDEAVRLDVTVDDAKIDALKRRIQSVEDEKVNVDIDVEDSALEGLVGKVGGALAGAGIADFLVSGIREAAEQGKFAEVFGLDGPVFSSLVSTAGAAGVEMADVIAVSLAGRTAQAEALAGDEVAVDLFRRLGLSPDAIANLDMAELIQAIVGNLGTEIDNSEFDALGKIFGETDVQFIARLHAEQYLNGWREGLSPEEVAKATDLQEDWDRLATNAKEAGVTAGIALADGVSQAVSDAEAAGDAAGGFQFGRMLDGIRSLLPFVNAAGEDAGETVIRGFETKTDAERQRIIDSWDLVFDGIESTTRTRTADIALIWDTHLQNLIDILNGKRPLVQAAWDQYADILSTSGAPGGGGSNRVDDSSATSDTRRSVEPDYASGAFGT